jgi:hypothetical protein
MEGKGGGAGRGEKRKGEREREREREREITKKWQSLKLKIAILKTMKLFFKDKKKESPATERRGQAGSAKVRTLFSDPGKCPCSNKQAPERELSAFLLRIKRTFRLRKARLIYESERSSFMADHKSVSAQLTLGNFPTQFSNQNRSVVSPLPRETHQADSRTLVGLSSLRPRVAGKQQKRGSAKGPGNWGRGQKIGRPHSGVATRDVEGEPRQPPAPKWFRSGNEKRGGGSSAAVRLGERTRLGGPQLFPSIVTLLPFGEPLILRDFLTAQNSL